MKYSDSVKTLLLAAIDEQAADPQEYAKRPGRDFSRNRKPGFKQLLLMFLTMEGDCIKEEIYTYFGRSTDAPDVKTEYDISLRVVRVEIAPGSFESRYAGIFSASMMEKAPWMWRD